MRLKTNPRRRRTRELPKIKIASSAKTVDYYRDAIKNLRIIARGFTPDDGFNLRDIRTLDDLTPAQKRTLTRWSEEYDYLFSRPHHVFTFGKSEREQKRMLRAQEFGGHHKKDKRLRAAVVPAIYPQEDAFLNYRDDGVVELVEHRGRIRSRDVIFDKEKLMVGEDAYLNQVLSGFPKDGYFLIMAGEHVLQTGGRKDRVIDEIIKLMNGYAEGKRFNTDPRDKNSHHWTNWLNGVRFYRTPEPLDMREELKEQKKALRDSRKEQKRKHDRLRRQFKQLRKGTKK